MRNWIRKFARKVEGDFKMYKPIESFKAFLAVQKAGYLVTNSVTNALKVKENRRGIPIYSTSTKEKGHGHKHRIKEGDGKEVLAASWRDWGGTASLETNTLRVHINRNVSVTLSELDKTGEWSKTTYTAEGKQINGQPLEPFTKDEGKIVADKIWANIFEETLPNISLKDTGFVQRFEKAVHLSMQKLLDNEAEIKAIKARSSMEIYKLGEIKNFRS